MICEGSESIAIGLLLPIVSKVWHLTIMEEAIGLTLINIGMPLGSFLQGYSDKHGRSPFVKLVSVIIVVFGFLSTITWSFPSFVIARFFYEIGIGMCLPLTAAYAT